MEWSAQSALVHSLPTACLRTLRLGELCDVACTMCGHVRAVVLAVWAKSQSWHSLFRRARVTILLQASPYLKLPSPPPPLIVVAWLCCICCTSFRHRDIIASLHHP